MSQLREIAEPFPDKFVHKNPSGGGSYVKHHVIVQRLLSVVGPFGYTVDELFYGEVRDRKGDVKLDHVVVGCRATLTAYVDGRQVRITEIGDCELPTNWLHDGARAKDAASDAIKRCAARLGLGLHLWSQDEYFLPAVLDKQPDSDGVITGGEDVSEPSSPAPTNGTPHLELPEQQPLDVGPQLGPDPLKPRMSDNKQKARIHILVNENDIDDRVYRTLLKAKYSVESSTELTHMQADELIAALADETKRAKALKWAKARVPQEATQ